MFSSLALGTLIFKDDQTFRRTIDPRVGDQVCQQVPGGDKGRDPKKAQKADEPEHLCSPSGSSGDSQLFSFNLANT